MKLEIGENLQSTLLFIVVFGIVAVVAICGGGCAAGGYGGGSYQSSYHTDDGMSHATKIVVHVSSTDQVHTFYDVDYYETYMKIIIYDGFFPTSYSRPYKIIIYDGFFPTSYSRPYHSWSIYY